MAVLRLVRAAPGVVTGEADVFPSERGEVTSQLLWYALTFSTQRVEGVLEILRVPQDDCRDQEVQPRCAIGLAFEGAVAQFAETMEEYGAGERIARLALVQSQTDPPPQVYVAHPTY